MNNHNLVRGNITKVIILFVVPMILGSLVQQLYTTFDAVIVGQFVGKEGLAAIDSVHTVFRFPINFMNGLGTGATIIISRYFGAKAYQNLKKAGIAAIIVSIFLGITSSILGIVFCDDLLKLLHVPHNIFDNTLLYCTIYFSGLWAMVMYNMMAGILRAFGDSRRPFYVLVLCSGVNIVGDLLLVGVFSLGVGGAACATVFSQIISVLILVYFLYKTSLNISLQTQTGSQLSLETQKNKEETKTTRYVSENGILINIIILIRKGFPLALQSLLFPIANTIVQAGVNNMGTEQIAAWGICDKLSLLIWLVADSMGPALTTYVAQNIGAGQYSRVRKGAVTGTLLSILCIGVISVILYVFSGICSTLFLTQKDIGNIVPLVVGYMRMMAPFYIFYAIAEAFSGVVCGLGDTICPMITTLLTICLFRVIGILFFLPQNNTMECIVWIYIASWILSGVSFFVLFYEKDRKICKMIDEFGK